MKLHPDFFLILTQECAGNHCVFHIQVDPDHLIYQGHFPGFPVTPAAIQLQMISELLEVVLNVPMRMKKLSQAKFVQVINPRETPTFSWRMTLQISLDSVEVHAQAFGGTDTFSRIKGTFIPDSPLDHLPAWYTRG